MLADEVSDLVVGLDGFAGVAPKAFQDVVLHQTAFQIPVVDVGDLELAASRRLELRDYLPDRLVVEVNAGHREIAGRLGGLLMDAGDPAVAIELRDAEIAQVLTVALPREHDACAPRLLLECGDARLERALENVVGEQDDAALAVDKLLRQTQRLGDSSRLLLVRV